MDMPVTKNLKLLCLGGLLACLMGCSGRPAESVAPVARGSVSQVGTNVTTPPAPELAPVVQQDLAAYVAELQPTEPQRLAIAQAEGALVFLATVDVTNASELELAVAEVLASSKCLRHVFTGYQENVPQVISQLAVATPEMRAEVERAFDAFKATPGAGPLSLLEPEGKGCIPATEAPDTTQASAPEGAEPSEVFFDAAGNVVPAPEPQEAAEEPPSNQEID